MISKIDLSKQVKVTKLTPQELDLVLLNDETIIYQNSYDEIIMANKVNNVIDEKTIYPIKINGLSVPSLPTSPPAYGQAYVLGLVQYGTGFTYEWVTTPTVFNYNNPSGTGVTSGSTFSVTVTQPTGQIFINNTLVANGIVQINTLSSLSKSFSIDNGVNWSPYTTSPNYTFNYIGSTVTEVLDILIKDSLNNILYQTTTTVNPIPTYYFNINDGNGILVPTLELSSSFTISATKINDSYYGNESGKVRVDVNDTQNNVLYAYAVGSVFGDPESWFYTNPTSSKSYTFEDLPAGTHVFAVKKYRRNFVTITEAVIDGVTETITSSWSYSIDDAVSFLPASTPTIIFYSPDVYGDKSIYLKNNSNFIYSTETTIQQQLPSGSELKTASAVIASVSSYAYLTPSGALDTPYDIAPSATGITFSCFYAPTDYPTGTTMNIQYENLTNNNKGITIGYLTNVGMGVFTGDIVIYDEFILEPEVLNIIKYRFRMSNNYTYTDVSDWNYIQIDLKP